ncbi:MAG TPA: PAS domain S-box protein, partial [Chryseolinea sp.]|nr:PAS domain S-box protein [Chryseolinea sp.]
NHAEVDLAFLDLSLPDSKGIDTFNYLNNRLPHTPIIIVTGLSDINVALEALSLGAQDYVMKGEFNEKLLSKAIRYSIERKKAELKIIQSETNLKVIFENTSEGFLLLDNDAIIKAFNNEATKYMLFSKMEKFQIGRSVYDYIERPRREYFEGIIERALKGESIHYDRSYEMENGRTVWIDFSLTPAIENGKAKGICITARNITEKKISEQEREFDRNNLKALINNTNDPMWSVDKDFRLITSNDAFQKLAKDMSGKAVVKGGSILASGFGQERLSRFRKYYERAFSGESFTEIEHADFPSKFWSEISFYPIYVGNIIIGAACFSRDINERKKAEEHLKLSEEKYRTLFFYSPLPKWLYDNETLKFLDVNEAAIRSYGYTREEFLSMTIRDIRPKEDVELLLKYLNKTGIERDLENGQWTHLKKDQEIIIVDITAHSIDYNNKKARMVIASDVTKKIKAEEDLRQSEMRLNEAQAIAHISNWEIDLVRNIHTWSDEFYRIYGLSKAEAQPSAELFLSFMHPDDAIFAQNKIQETFVSSGESSFDFRFIRKDGVTRYGYTEWRFEFDKKGNPIRLFGILQDITERKEAEENLRLLEEKILEQKIQEQKRIARAIIKAQEKERNYLGQELHDNINQILASTKLLLEVAESNNEESKQLIKYPKELLISAMQEIRILSSKLVTPSKNINLKELIKLLLDDQRKTTAMKTAFVYDLPGLLIGDDLKLNIYRIIQEELNNIVKHAAAEKVGISLQADNGIISIVVEDDGKGFDINRKRKGIGISNIMNRIESFNGEVIIESSPGKGCRTVIKVPY